jgi:hypothetical protein
MSPMRKYLVVVLPVFAGIPLNLEVQDVYGALHGTVTDSTGPVVAGPYSMTISASGF